MLSVVLVPMILVGFLISTRVRRAARLKRASAEMPRPGAMAPPRNSPLRETTSKVVAVPMSTTMAGPPRRSKAATQLTTRSAPTSLGLSVRMGRPVLTPGSMNNGLTLRKVSQTRRRVESSGGTTDAMAMPSMAESDWLRIVKRFWSCDAISSVVCLYGVVMRQSASRAYGSPSVAGRKRPIEVFELPTSSASSIVRFPASFPIVSRLSNAAREDRVTDAIVICNLEETVKIDAVRQASISARLGDMDALASYPGGGRRETGEEIVGAFFEAGQFEVERAEEFDQDSCATYRA